MGEIRERQQEQAVAIPSHGSTVAIFLRVMGPGFLVAVGYMDPGNWATDLAAGSRYGYQLLWVVGLSSLMAMVLQTLCCRLGLATGMNLAQAYRLLTPVMGTSMASLLFGVALLAAGQSSTLTGTLAGQVVMDGFLNLRLPGWQRRLITRGVALSLRHGHSPAAG